MLKRTNKTFNWIKKNIKYWMNSHKYMMKYCDHFWNGTKSDKSENVSMRERKQNLKRCEWDAQQKKNYIRNCHSTTTNGFEKEQKTVKKNKKFGWRKNMRGMAFENFFSLLSQFWNEYRTTRNMSTRITIAVAITTTKNIVYKKKRHRFICGSIFFIFLTLSHVFFISWTFKRCLLIYIHPNLKLSVEIYLKEPIWFFFRMFFLVSLTPTLDSKTFEMNYQNTVTKGYA